MILNRADPNQTPELQVLMRPCKAMINHSPALVNLVKTGQRKAIKTAMADAMQGMQSARSTDAHVLKIRISDLVREKSTDPAIALLPQGKVNRGFNHPVLSQMILPIDYLKDFNKNPTSIQAKINGGDEVYPVTADLSLSFLYEDPGKYDPEDVYIGFMRGYYLVHCFQAIFASPSTAMEAPTMKGKPIRSRAIKRYNISCVTLEMIAYATVQARFAISSEPNWGTMDGLFDYDVFFNVIVEIFDQDEEWKQDTIQWWNKEVFGNEHGFKIMRTSTGPVTNGALAKAKMQAARRRAAKLSTRSNAIEPTEARSCTPPSPQVSPHPSHVPDDDRGGEEEGEE
ncbi:hypothetical protein EI94DRAFT_1703920 [Lactarius quietus]|nr:hypothetical protein EI94DRAFT_1703920 [Lactarius quietus]